MKIWIVAGVLSLSSLAQAQEARDHLLISLDVKINEVYNREFDGIFKSHKSTGETNLKINGTTKQGENINYDSGPVKNERISLSELRIVGDNQIEIKDSVKGTTRLFKAEIREDLIRVSSEEVGSAVAADLKKQGQDLVKKLSLENNEGNVNYQFDISDMTCARTAQVLSCDLSAQLLLEATGK